MRRLAILVYGGLCYALAMATILYGIAFVGGFAPKSIDAGGIESGGILAAVIVDLVLLGIFAVQHSVMARPAFKAKWTTLVSPVIERSTYVLAASLALLLLYWQWRPIGGTVWTAGQPLAGVLVAIFWIGWAVVFLSTFLINHFDLFGLSQVWAAWQGRPRTSPGFQTPFFYKVVRHPIYFGFLLAFWATPVMTYSHLLFAAASTGYIFVGMWLEEQDLVAHFGDAYRRYRERVAMIIPMPPRRG
jgi:methanethiol S-methyltransferase